MVGGKGFDGQDLRITKRLIQSGADFWISGFLRHRGKAVDFRARSLNLIHTCPVDSFPTLVFLTGLKFFYF